MAAVAVAGTDGAAGEPAMVDVLRLIGNASCKTDADCRTVAVGTRACGGPQRYLAWSTVQTDERALAAAVGAADARQAAQDAKARHPPASTCVFIADPGAQCLPADGTARRCVPGTGAGAR